MDQVNLSSLPTSSLQFLINFVSQFNDFSHLAQVRILDRAQVGRTCGGKAYFESPLPGSTSLVDIWVSRGISYPTKVTECVPEVGAVTVRSLEEEFVFVLAHELRHIDQMHTQAFVAGEEHEAEVDAEEFALAVLKQFRKAQKKVA